jgi:RsiW-degrading membrane proteinase PrsW (M82 family)
MASVSDTLTSFNGILRDVAGFGIALAGTLLVVQVIYPSDTYSIVGNVKDLVTTFTTGGVAGLITLLLFVTFMRR